jgi:hypothetical protein
MKKKYKPFWREQAEPLIIEVIRQNPKASIQELRTALGKAYPWGVSNREAWKGWEEECFSKLSDVIAHRERRRKKKKVELVQSDLFEAPA